MLPRLLTLDSLVISQTKSFMQDEFLIADEQGVPVGTILQSTSLKDMFFNSSRSLEVAFTDEQGNPQQPLMVGTPVAINPDSKLRDIAEEKGWLIRDYRSVRKAVRTYGLPALATALFSYGSWRFVRR